MKILKKLFFVLIIGLGTEPLLVSSIDATAKSQAKMLRFANAVVIQNNYGGHVAEFAIKVANLRRAKKPVALKGRCDSACTLYLSLPPDQLCISTKVKFGFHAAYKSGGLGLGQVRHEAATRYLMSSYPSWVRSWIKANGGLTRSIKIMSYTYASKFLTTCPT